MIIYINTENNKRYRISVGKVFADAGRNGWLHTPHIKPCDLAHYPYIGVRRT